jgi:hypothetical protein
MKNNAQKATQNRSNARLDVSPRIFAIAFWLDPFLHPPRLSWNPNLIGGDIWGVRWISDSFSSVPRPHSIADRGPTFISAEHPLFLVEVSTESAGIMPLLQRRLRIRLLDLQLVRHPSTHGIVSQTPKTVECKTG